MSTRSVADQILNEGRFNGIFAGWGMSRVVAMNYSAENTAPKDPHGEDSHKPLVIADTKNSYSMYDDEKPRLSQSSHSQVSLGSFLSIALAGCDLMSSALYTPGTVATYSGKYTFVGLFLVTLMLSMFRKVYSEAVTAIPVNGGTYNLVLNTVNKKLAAFVACLSVLSYIATAIISAFDSMVYLSILWPDINLRLFTVLVMLFFGAVTICGVSESSIVNASIFVFHMFALTLLILWGFAYGCQDGFKIFHENMHTSAPQIVTSEGVVLAKQNAMAAIYFGYSAGLLGITGFETASNYVEELASTSVFVTTVNGLWLLVGIYNPLISLVSMMILPLDDIYAHPGELLAEMAKKLGGDGFSTFICVDAVIVLCGAVLTSIIGISGLLVRLSKDRILPDSFALTNYRGAPYVSIIAFVAISITLFLSIYDPKSDRAINDFAGVYSISFLSVLLCFAGGAILLKLYRPRIARLVIAQWWEIVLSGLSVFVGFIGNIVLTPGVFYVFLIYLSGFIALAAYMFARVEVLSFAIWMIRKIWMNQKKRKLEENDSDIIQACQIQDQYNERSELIKVDINRKAIRKAVRKSILSYQREKDQKNENEQENNNNGGKGESNEVRKPSEGGIELSRLDNNNDQNTPTPTPSQRFGWIPRRMMSTSSQISVESIENRDHKSHFSDYINIVQQRFSTSSLYAHIPNLRYYDRSAGSLNDLELILQRPIVGKYLKYLMKSLDELVSQPFCYLAKHSDPISLQLAINYIDANELSNNIYILHFVDDRKVVNAFEEYRNEYNHYLNDAHGSNNRNPGEEGRSRRYSFQLPDNGMVLKLLMKPPGDSNNKKNDGRSSMEDTDIGSGEASEEKSSEFSVANQFTLESCVSILPVETQQLLQNVAILDAYYAYKKIHAIVIRGGFFCPSCLDSVADYLNIRKNNMIMGVPDSKFPFPFAKLNGCRIAIPDAESSIRQNSTAHLKLLLENPSLFTQLQQQQQTALQRKSSSFKREEDDENMDDLNSEPPEDDLEYQDELRLEDVEQGKFRGLADLKNSNNNSDIGNYSGRMQAEGGSGKDLPIVNEGNEEAAAISPGQMHVDV